MGAKSEYRNIIKSTTLFGGVQLLVILFGVIRTKFTAIFIGPEGVGIIGILSSTMALIQVASGLGLVSSAVREIAVASGTNDEIRISNILKSVRRLLLLTGLLGFVLTLLFSKQISILSFGSDEYSLWFVILSLTCILSSVSDGQNSILQGLGKLKYLGLSTILGAFVATVASFFSFYFFGKNGIILSLMTISVSSVVFSFLFYKKIQIKQINQSIRETFSLGRGMIKLGISLMLSGFITYASTYILNSLISNIKGPLEVGLYRAAWTIAVQYTSIIFTAMGSAYLPKLSSISNHRNKIQNCINQQAEIIVIVIAPLVVFFIAFADFIVELFYTSSFLPIINMLRLFMIGMILRSVSWVLSYIFIAKGDSKVFIVTELIGGLLLIITSSIGYMTLGLDGIALAFIFSYLVYLIIVSAIIKVRYYLFLRPRVMLLSIVVLFIGVLSYFLNTHNFIVASVIQLICVVILSIYLLNKKTGLIKGLLKKGGL